MTTHASHFNGGAITWQPIDPYSNSSSIGITITQTYSWTYPEVNCTTNVPISSGKNDVNLTCIANCSTDGGYSNAVIDIITDCTSYSTTLSTVSSQRSVNVTLNAGAYFFLAYQDKAWRKLYATSTSNLQWSIVTLIDLRVRSDGMINTPPVANVLSPQYVIFNTTTLINIPVDICYPSGLPSDTSLSNCTLSFTGSVANKCYPMALQVEDYMSTSSIVAMSSVSVQLLICVESTPNCTRPPSIVPLTDCLVLQTSVSTNYTVYIMNLCNSSATITEVIISKSISGMIVSSLTNSTTNTSLSYITLTWTPQASQTGTQELCLYAYNSLLVRSTQYCVTFTVATSSSSCLVTTTTTISSTNKNTNDINVPLIVGLSLLGLLVSLCYVCCWVYYFHQATKQQSWRDKTIHENMAEKKHWQLPPPFTTRKFPFKILNHDYLFRKMLNSQDTTSNCHSSTPTVLSNMFKNSIVFSAAENPTHNNTNQEFERQSIRPNVLKQHYYSVTRIPRSKLSTVSTAQQFKVNKTNKTNNHMAATTNSVIRDIAIQDVRKLIHQGGSMGGIELNIGNMTDVQENQITNSNTSIAIKQRRTHSMNTV
ncbi:unnamed protein product [Rotaria magnacalcarata]|uniref:Uncharacterized protein n=3 Tax=Rotaria magnacalcarata TaxID=392030 RepID=A0A814TX36_9BILA|nr:unnamed protein product [Rotaria magnacalcarata]CAF3866477.1 unnamed protein product [Rotaria magnacalcarata]